MMTALTSLVIGVFWAQASFAKTTTAEIFATTSANIISEGLETEIPKQQATSDALFEAKVVEIVEQKEVDGPNGAKITQQNVKLVGLKDEWKNKEYIFYGISDVIAVGSNTYRKGDKVLASKQVDINGKETVYIVDFVKRWPLLILSLLFVLAIAIVGRARGLRSIAALILSFFIILKGTIPLILAGWNPLAVGIATCVLIFILLIYITDGWHNKSHIAIVSLALSMVAIALLSWLFTWLTRLTGMAGDEAMFLINIGKQAIDFKGLLLAGILIGALGVLDDIVVGQIEAVEQIKKANPKLPASRTFKLALDVGNAHIGAMVNTLFLAYAGASLPLLILFSVKEPPFLTFGQVINNELVAGEIVRTLVGSLGIALAMPLATYLAAKFYREKQS